MCWNSSFSQKKYKLWKRITQESRVRVILNVWLVYIAIKKSLYIALQIILDFPSFYFYHHQNIMLVNVNSQKNLQKSLPKNHDLVDEGKIASYFNQSS